MKLSIIIPIFNEEATARQIIEKAASADTKNCEKQIIVVDDGSLDGTLKQLESARQKYGFTLIRHEKNSGKSAAIKTALNFVAASDKDAVIIQDADLEYDPSDWKQMLDEFDKGCPVVYGSRNLGHSDSRSYLAYFLGARALTGLCNLLFGSSLTDMYTCYKLIRADIIREAGVESKRFDFCPEITSKILSKRYSIREVPIKYYPRSFKDGKKIRFKDGLSGAATLIKRRFFKK